MRRSLLPLLFLAGCGGQHQRAAPTPPPSNPTESAPLAAATPPPSSPPTTTKEEQDQDAVLTPDVGNTLADKTTVIMIRGARNCFELPPSTSNTSTCTEVARGGAIECVNDRWGIYIDDSGKWRARALHPKVHTIVGKSPTTLELGDHAVYGDWDVQWIAIRFPVGGRRSAIFRGRHRNHVTAEWPVSQTSGFKSEYDLPSHNRLFTLNVSLVSISNEPARAGGSVTIIALQSDASTAATFGQALRPGVYTFADGLRIQFENRTECDFDPTAPCVGRFTVEAKLAQNEGHLDLTGKKRTGKLLDHTFEINSSMQLVVKK